MNAKAFLGYSTRCLALAILIGLVLIDIWAFAISYNSNPRPWLNSLAIGFPYPPPTWSEEILGIGSGIGAFLLGYIFFERKSAQAKNSAQIGAKQISIFGIVFILGSILLIALSYFASHSLVSEQTLITCVTATEPFETVPNCIERIPDEGYAFLKDATTTAYKLLAVIVGMAISAINK